MSVVSYLYRLEKVLKQHPLFVLKEFHVEPVTNNSLFSQFEKEYGMELPALIKQIYSESNGFRISYYLKDDNESVNLFMKSSPYVPGKTPIGSINFIEFENIFFNDHWKGLLYETNSLSDEDAVHFNRSEFTYNSLGKKLKPFDLFSEETCAAFILTGKNSFDVILLDDYYADWKSSRITSFETYLKLILLTGGLTQSRQIYMSEIDGDEKPLFKIAKNKSIIPSFFKNMLEEVMIF